VFVGGTWRRLSRPKLSFGPCLPRPAKEPPTAPDLIDDIKHDGFRIIARKDATGVRLVTRNGYDFRDRFPLAVAAMDALSAQSCIIDSEAIVCDDNGLSVFNLMRYRHYDQLATLCAFDLLELNGQDMRNEPIEERKAALKMVLRKSHPGIDFNRHFDVEGSIVFHHACKLGCEGIVSKRLGSVVFGAVEIAKVSPGSRAPTRPETLNPVVLPKASFSRVKIAGAARKREARGR
jgi:bifunctional non-homologous end joining protein LigD